MLAGEGTLGAMYKRLSASDKGTLMNSAGKSSKTSATAGGKGAQAVYDAMTGAGGVLACTANGEDCSASRCCSEAGMTCYKKNDHWASCNQTCNTNMMWTADSVGGYSWQQTA